MAACLGENGAAELFLFGHFEKGIQEPLDSNFDQREKKLMFIYICIYMFGLCCVGRFTLLQWTHCDL